MPTVTKQPTRLLLEKRNGRLGHEEQILESIATQKGISVEYLTEKLVARGFVKLAPTDLLAGSLPFIKHALRMYGVKLEDVQCPDYPGELTSVLYRNVRKDLKLNQVKELLDKGVELFVKPQDCKIFTGFVASDSNDPRFNGVSGQRKVYACDPVEFMTEWRFYIAEGHVGAAGHYAGDPEQTISFDTVKEILKPILENGTLPAGCAVDFGLLSDHSVALVEVNDGFSVGCYCQDHEHYWAMISARWQQLIGVNWGE